MFGSGRERNSMMIMIPTFFTFQFCRPLQTEFLNGFEELLQSKYSTNKFEFDDAPNNLQSLKTLYNGRFKNRTTVR